MEISYEDLTGAYADDVWAAVHHFLGAGAGYDVFVQIKKVWSPSMKLHPGTCQSKILNWPQVAAAIQGTDTLEACNAEQQAETELLVHREHRAPAGMSSIIRKALNKDGN